ncbi:hypothetical protein ACJX0J_036202, partial [Zea mays]
FKNSFGICYCAENISIDLSMTKMMRAILLAFLWLGVPTLNFVYHFFPSCCFSSLTETEERFLQIKYVMVFAYGYCLGSFESLLWQV